ncbi:hypothetical protein AAHC03_021197 [Spirometra sp. Aus1]
MSLDVKSAERDPGHGSTMSVNQKRNSTPSNGLMSFFSTRQRKSPTSDGIFDVSVKHSRLMCVARIDEVIQTVSDLVDFYSKIVKAESKISIALWRTVSFSKVKKTDTRKLKPTGYTIGPPEAASTNSINRLSEVSSSESARTSPEEMDETPLPVLSRGVRGSNVASQAKQLLQCFLEANETRAEVAACRAAFHKKITTCQLLLILEGLQRLRTLYIDRDTMLESYSSQLESDVRECWKKYAKYADTVARLRTRLSVQFEKGLSNKRKAIETSLNELEAATLKLHTIHNAYTLSLAIARQYSQWLVTRVRPCLLRNLDRCLRLVDFAISYLLRLARVEQVPSATFEQLSLPEAEPLGEVSLDPPPLSSSSDEDSFRRAFPFDQDLIVRAGDEALQPDKIIVNQITFNQVQHLLQTHLQEAANQKSMTGVFEEEHQQLAASLTQWVETLSQRTRIYDLPSLLKTEESLNEYLLQLESKPQPSHLSPRDNSSSSSSNKNSKKWPPLLNDSQAYMATAMKPGNLCALAISLGTCEFFHCQSACFAESHGQIVNILREAKVSAPTPLPSTAAGGASISNPTALPQFSSSGDLLQLHNSGLLDSRFHALRVQVDAQDATVLGEAPKCTPESGGSASEREENHHHHHRQQSTGASSTSEAPEPPVRRSVKALKEEFYRNSGIAVSRASSNPTASAAGLAEVEAKKTVKQPTGNHGNSLPTSPASPSHQPLFQSRLGRADQFVDSSSRHRPASKLFRRSSESQSSASSSVPRAQSTDALNISGSSSQTIHQDTPTTRPPAPDNETVDINKEPWFHGVLPRSEVVRLLQVQGDFLVRETSKATSSRKSQWNRMPRNDSESDLWAASARFSQSTEELSTPINGRVVVTKMVLSVYWNGYKHFIIQGGDSSNGRKGGWSLEDYAFPTIRDLVEYHMRTGKPVTAGSGALLLNPIARPDWQLDNADVQLLEKIGQGNFGEVHRGMYNGRMVAVKTCRANPVEVEVRRKFLQGEATALNFCHPNIVQLIGIAVRTHPIMIVMEYVAGGSLLSYLRKTRNNPDIGILLRMSVDAANGMAYLESKNCIHRDLAARNCLLTEDLTLKIADFGMAREEHVYELSDRNGPIPIKWTAPEALASNRYTSKCDVWSFGILLWEMFTGGDTPYRGLSNNETRDLVESGYRLKTPEWMPRQLGKQMQSCWAADPNRRPTFANLVESLSKLKREFEGDSGRAANSTIGSVSHEQKVSGSHTSQSEEYRARELPHFPQDLRAVMMKMMPQSLSIVGLRRAQLVIRPPLLASGHFVGLPPRVLVSIFLLLARIFPSPSAC